MMYGGGQALAYFTTVLPVHSPCIVLSPGIRLLDVTVNKNLSLRRVCPSHVVSSQFQHVSFVTVCLGLTHFLVRRPNQRPDLDNSCGHDIV